MSPKLKPLLLPQLVEERKKTDLSQLPITDYGFIPSPYALATTNSSSSDITSPVTPTFSTRGHVRYSSSTSSIDIPPLPVLESIPTSPLPQSTKQSRPLPDVQEEPTEPMEREEPVDFMQEVDQDDHFGLYSCLCDEPCDHRSSSDDLFPVGLGLGLGSDYDLDYDVGFLSDGAGTSDSRIHRKKRSGTASPLTELTTRLSSRFPTIKRWKSSRRSTMNSIVAQDFNLDNVLSRAPSSRSSSLSRRVSVPPTPALAQFGSSEDISRQSTVDLTEEEHSTLERDRSMATTPLLPPLMTGPIGAPPVESPLQSPTIEAAQMPLELPAAPAPTAVTLPARPPLSTRPSTTSLRQISNSTELPIAFPGLPDYDEWSDRLGHANFTINPQPYEPTNVSPETITRFREDWNTARVNYTKHLVRTGENYGQTSKIYGLTEAKWAETERRWKTIYEDVFKTNQHSAPVSQSTSRSRSRGRGRGRSVSATGGVKIRHADEDMLAGMEWRRLEECLPSAVPQMLEAMDAEGKFPGRGDEDIVGPMQRDAYMAGAYVEDARSQRFWRNLAGKVGLR